MLSQFIQIFVFMGCLMSFEGAEDSKICPTDARFNCSQCIICTEYEDNHIYPGRILSLQYNLFIPRGELINAVIDFKTSADFSVIMLDVKLTFQDSNLTMTNGSYHPVHTSEGPVVTASESSYYLGDIECNGTRAFVTNSTVSVESINEDTITDSHKSSDNGTFDPCTYCLLKLDAEYLMSNVPPVFDNSIQEVSAIFISEGIITEAITTLVLKATNVSSKESNFSTNIPDVVEHSISGTTTFKIRAMLPNPLSSYILELKSKHTQLQIATSRVSFVGEHFRNFILPSSGPDPKDTQFCDMPTTRTIFLYYLPNIGAFDDNASANADIVEFEIMVVMTHEAVIGKVYALEINMQTDFVQVMNSTKYFEATDGTPIKYLNITTAQSDPLVPKSGTGYATLTWDVPLQSCGIYSINSSMSLISGSGGNGLILAGIQVAYLGSNLPCIETGTHWKLSGDGSVNIFNIPYERKSMQGENKFGFHIIVLAIPEKAESFSSYELSTTITYPGEGSPQSFQFYFNITDQEVFTFPDENGILPLSILLNETCRSLLPSTDVELILRTDFYQTYGRLYVELPTTSDLLEQSFVICNVGKVRTGYNVLGRFNETIIRRHDDMIEKVLVDISPLTNIYFATLDGVTVNEVSMKMTVTFIDKSLQLNNLPKHFTARVISNDTVIWSGYLPITKPSIEYFPEFIVVTKIAKTNDTNTERIWYHYSRTGSYYHQDTVTWVNGSNEFQFDFPKVISYFYFSADPCTVVCHVTAVTLPLRDYVTILKDNNNTMLKMLPYALDQDLNTCFALPVLGDFPPILLMMITKLSLFNVTSQIFEVRITGEGIQCGNIGNKRLQVGTSGPVINQECSFESDIKFCKLRSHSVNATLTQCDFECNCKTLLHCSNVHIFMQSTNTDPWNLCELTMLDM